ncbi:MAG: phytanoyl-CoA dioxygenase family protein [Fuerstiella sp.]|nr:phytanoyl-CoA dioxygenase family protein [Fuerstiella sp.]MCP4854662.1 phytanoyl-CoA dioxygenase family protein [Fuerstiella sp.]
MLKQEVCTDQLSVEEVETFRREGFIVQRSLIPLDYVDRILQITKRDETAYFGDIEYEADVQYPGAPQSLTDEGGRTIRRLRQAFSRDPVFARLVKEPFVVNRLRQLLGEQVVMPLAHHNCVMTKHPKYSSDTGWHQDTRYWSFTRSELVNVWVALGDETVTNGCLRLLPGSHRMVVEPDQLDDELFFRDDLPRNQSILSTAATAELKAGDALFFHACCLHSATRNYSDRTKYSAVFTFRSLDNPPLSDSRSSELPELLL